MFDNKIYKVIFILACLINISALLYEIITGSWAGVHIVCLDVNREIKMADHPVREDLTDNPMGGYRSSVDPISKTLKHHPTMMMPVVTPEQAKQRDGGNKTVFPTEEMETVYPPLSVKNIIKELIEVNVAAWKKLPIAIQDIMLSTPEKFMFHRGFGIPDLIFNGIRFKFENECWSLYSLESK